MARSRCTCGSQVQWKADETESDEFLIARWSTVNDTDTIESLMAGPVSAARCPTCGRLWVDWGDGDGLTEYVPVRPSGDVT